MKFISNFCSRICDKKRIKRARVRSNYLVTLEPNNAHSSKGNKRCTTENRGLLEIEILLEDFFVIAYQNWFEVIVVALQLKAVIPLDKVYPRNSKCFSVISRSIQILVVKQNIKYHGETFGIRKKRQRTSTGKKYILYSNS